MSLSLLDNQTRLAPNEFFPQLGGGGGGGPSTIVSTFNQLFVSSIGSSEPAGVSMPNGIAIPGGGEIAFGAKLLAAADISFANNEGEITGVSTINGSVYPPAGAGVFQSTFAAVSCPANTSTILMELSPGQWGFNGICVVGGNTDYLAGFVSVLSNVASGINYGNLNATPSNQPTALVVAEPTLNFGDSGLSTIKFIVANTSATSGAFTGILSKLY